MFYGILWSYSVKRKGFLNMKQLLVFKEFCNTNFGTNKTHLLHKIYVIQIFKADIRVLILSPKNSDIGILGDGVSECNLEHDPSLFQRITRRNVLQRCRINFCDWEGFLRIRTYDPLYNLKNFQCHSNFTLFKGRIHSRAYLSFIVHVATLLVFFISVFQTLY